jgi:amicyanin
MKEWFLSHKREFGIVLSIAGTTLLMVLVLLSFLIAKQNVAHNPGSGASANGNSTKNASGSSANQQNGKEAEVVSPTSPTPPPVTGDPGQSVPASEEHVVNINNSTFSPAILTVKKGSKVIWINRDNDRHNVIADDFAADGLNGPVLENNQAYIFTFTKIGEFPYHCGPHPSMQAKVVVTE